MCIASVIYITHQMLLHICNNNTVHVPKNLIRFRENFDR